MSESPLLTIHRFEGRQPGPRLLISAGVHGDEYLPMLALRELVQRLRDDDELRSRIRGRLTLIPIVNLPAFQRGHRCGPDGKDLARTCPGRRDGTPTERFAYALSNEIKKADYYVDLHTGGTEYCVVPLAGYMLHADGTILERQRKLARAFQLPFVWGTSAALQGRSLSVARDAGVPAIYVEYLGAHRELVEVASGAITSGADEHPLVRGCLNVMRHVGILDEEAIDAIEIETIEDWRPDSGHMQVSHPAPATGFLIPRVVPGESVVTGDRLADIVPVCEGEPYSVRAQSSGKVVALREYPRVNQGDGVAVIAENHPPAPAGLHQ